MFPAGGQPPVLDIGTCPECGRLLPLQVFQTGRLMWPCCGAIKFDEHGKYRRAILFNKEALQAGEASARCGMVNRKQVDHGKSGHASADGSRLHTGCGPGSHSLYADSVRRITGR